jgi:NAD(P)-dependent dehydrogenase (short-subunit alcohol dehydrogenase family)
MADLRHAPIGLFKGELAVVTGSASNIGRAIALALAREGAHVVLADVDDERNAAARSLISEAGGSAEAVAADLSLADGWRAILGALAERPVHMLVHSACPRRHETDTPHNVSEATFDAMLTTNVRSGFFLGREIGARMKAAGTPGRLLFITSLHAEAPRNLAHYSASKAGMTMVMKELARDLGPAGIRVNALAPGAVPGGGAANVTSAFAAKIPLGRTGTAEDMADTAVALLSNRFSGYVTGTTVAVDGGLALYNWIPFSAA